jgi:hypothetical protein
MYTGEYIVPEQRGFWIRDALAHRERELNDAPATRVLASCVPVNQAVDATLWY